MISLTIIDTHFSKLTNMKEPQVKLINYIAKHVLTLIPCISSRAELIVRIE